MQQVLLKERKDGCWWFQEAGRCDINTCLMVVLVACALADLSVSLYIVLLGSEELSDNTKWCGSLVSAGSVFSARSSPRVADTCSATIVFVSGVPQQRNWHSFCVVFLHKLLYSHREKIRGFRVLWAQQTFLVQRTPCVRKGTQRMHDC